MVQYIHNNNEGMIKIEVYCSLVLLSLFVVSMLGSLSHADIDATYSLFAFYALLTYRQYNSIREVLVVVMGATGLVLVSDFWVMGLMQFEATSGANRFFGYVWTGLEICLKIALLVMLVSWRVHISEEDAKTAQGKATVNNSEAGY
jgi:Ca2+/Na+ antiporter